MRCDCILKQFINIKNAKKLKLIFPKLITGWTLRHYTNNKPLHIADRLYRKLNAQIKSSSKKTPQLKAAGFLVQTINNS